MDSLSGLWGHRRGLCYPASPSRLGGRFSTLWPEIEVIRWDMRVVYAPATRFMLYMRFLQLCGCNCELR